MILKILVNRDDIDSICLMKEINEKKNEQLLTIPESAMDEEDKKLLAMTFTMKRILDQFYFWGRFEGGYSRGNFRKLKNMLCRCMKRAEKYMKENAHYVIQNMLLIALWEITKKLFG